VARGDLAIPEVGADGQRHGGFWQARR
jgi:hypothetical protein